MVKETIDDRQTETFSFRMSAELKRRLEEVARSNRRTLSREIAFRLADSLGLELASEAHLPPIASETARRALAKTAEHAARLDDHEARLLKLEARK